MPNASPVVVRFDEYELDCRSFELRRSGAALKLEPKVFDLLAFLVAHREAFANMEAKKPILKLAWMAPPFGKTAAERWVTRPAAKELALSVPGSGSTTAFVREDILLWVGDHTGYGPGWATFGDLVSIYGDHKVGVESLNGISANDLQTLQCKGTHDARRRPWHRCSNRVATSFSARDRRRRPGARVVSERLNRGAG